MANPYFSNLTEFIYVNRTKEGRSEGDYSVVKNFFKRARLRDDIFQDLTFFTKFTVVGDDRPDTVANTVYDDPSLDWVVLLSNNIINVQSEWPLGQAAFNTYVTEKYPDEETLYSGIHHYEANEVKTNDGSIIIASGTRVSVGQSVSYFDEDSSQHVVRTDIASPVTNYMFEDQLNEDKRNITVLRPSYLELFVSDMRRIMTYSRSSQYVTNKVVQTENTRNTDPN